MTENQIAQEYAEVLSQLQPLRKAEPATPSEVLNRFELEIKFQLLSQYLSKIMGERIQKQFNALLVNKPENKPAPLSASSVVPEASVAPVQPQAAVTPADVDGSGAAVTPADQ